jgi:hypothetical protein
LLFRLHTAQFRIPTTPAPIKNILLCMLEAVEGELKLLDALDALEVMRCVLLCIGTGGRGGWALFAGGVGGGQRYGVTGSLLHHALVSQVPPVFSVTSNTRVLVQGPWFERTVSRQP